MKRMIDRMKALVRKYRAFAMTLLVAFALPASAFATAEPTPTPIDLTPFTDSMASALESVTGSVVSAAGSIAVAGIGILALVLTVRIGLYIYRRITAARG